MPDPSDMPAKKKRVRKQPQPEVLDLSHVDPALIDQVFDDAIAAGRGFRINSEIMAAGMEQIKRMAEQIGIDISDTDSISAPK
jgi:ribosomal protein L13E